jgi:hypothetical protein
VKQNKAKFLKVKELIKTNREDQSISPKAIKALSPPKPFKQVPRFMQANQAWFSKDKANSSN